MRNEILALLPPDYPWGQELICYPEIGSTNTELKALAKKGTPQGTALIALRQTGGRGRMGRSFQSEEGGVYLSLLLRPQCRAEELMHLTCAVAVAMCEAVEQVSGLRPGIKWTNDLVYGKRKLGGILTELLFDKDGTVAGCILGIGINCAQQEHSFAPEIRDIAVSLSTLAGRHISPAALAAAMLSSLRKMSGALFAEKEAILRRYRDRCVTLGQEISLVRPDLIRHGKALDITDEGALIVEFPDGSREVVSSGEVSIRGMYGYV